MRQVTWFPNPVSDEILLELTMGRVTKVLLALAVVVPMTAYVAGSLASPGAPPPPDHSRSRYRCTGRTRTDAGGG